MNKSLILELKGNSLDDGPGIRTVVFFKGCPLSCVWCHNPESKRAVVEISFDSNECVACDTCLDACPQGALSRENPFFIDRNRCDLCFDCAASCPSGALARVGEQLPLESVMASILKDKPFFETSGGGVTFSGGEPTLYMGYLSELMRNLKVQGIQTLVETCGHFQLDAFLDQIYPHTDLIYYDIKIMDPHDHETYCGRTNERILSNFIALHRQYLNGGIEILPRIPLIPGITDTPANINAIIKFFHDHRVTRTHLMAYHPLWQEKNLKIGVQSPQSENEALRKWMEHDKVVQCEAQFREAGIEI